ncbi:MAG: PilZ domain-containing protein [Pseudomonadota bacterium]
MKYRTRRRMTQFEVTLHADGCPHSATILDVTERGARMRLGSGNLAPGTLVSMGIHGQTFEADVVWNKDSDIGVAFEGVLPLDVLAAINRNLRRVQDRVRNEC